MSRPLVGGAEVLRQDSDFVLRRTPGAAGDGQGRLTLALVAERPTEAMRGQLLNELRLRDQLDASWAARPLAITGAHGREELSFEDPGGELLSRSTGAPWALDAFLPAALAIAVALGGAHEIGLVHRDVKPSNVFLDGQGRAHLTGFGFASKATRERDRADDTAVTGTLAYMSPEQTGRVRRPVDERSDLYALGVTFYELLTGSVPFRSREPLEVIYCHVAKLPASPRELVETVPDAVSAIVLKLLAKAPEDRYQTAHGLERDLRRCAEELAGTGRIDEFALGERDASSRLCFPERLYGRDVEMGTLIAALERGERGGARHLVLVSGEAGVGKSALVEELRRRRSGTPLFVASGKADQAGREVPHAPILQALRSVLRSILGRSDAELRAWRRHLLDGVRAHGRLLVDTLPELGLIVGAQPPVVEVPLAEAQARFHVAVGRLLGVLAGPKHPLVMFLDDLQWADVGTLELLDHVLFREGASYLIVVAAFRDEAMETTHRFAQLIARVRERGEELTEIELAPLGGQQLVDLVADTLAEDSARVLDLVQLVEEKTRGNPFFVRQYLAALHERRLLRFDAASRSWMWSDARIRATAFTDNIVGLMMGRLGRLSPTTRTVLRTLSCLGKSASVRTLSLALDCPPDDVHGRIAEAVRVGLVGGTADEYFFLHDRIQETAYASIPPAERAAEHLTLGRRFARTSATELDGDIFSVVSQYNAGASLLDSTPERRNVAALNLRAANRARTSGAFDSARVSLTMAKSLLSDQVWEEDQDFAFYVELGLAECELFACDYPTAERRLDALGSRAGSRVEQGGVVCATLQLYVRTGRFLEAIDLGWTYLRHGPLDWPSAPTDEDVDAEYRIFTDLLGARPIASVVDLPPAVDPDGRAAMAVLSALAAPGWYGGPALFVFLTLRTATMSLRLGNTAASLHAYAASAGILLHRFGRHRDAVDLAEAAAVTAQGDEYGFSASVTLGLFSIFVLPWARSMHEAPGHFERAMRQAVDIGDMTQAAYCSFYGADATLNCGRLLSGVEELAHASRSFSRRFSFGQMDEYHSGMLGLVRSLRGQTVALGSFSNELEDEVEIEARLTNLAPIAHFYWTRKLQALFFAGRLGEACAAADKARATSTRGFHYFQTAEMHLYSALVRGARSRGGTVTGDLAKDLAEHRAALGSWAEQCAVNFRCHLELVDAEIARAGGRELDAERHYEAALSHARAHRWVDKEALANEVAARFYLDRGFASIGGTLLREARDAYQRWGAVAKVRQLEEEFRGLAAERTGVDSVVLSETSIDARGYAAVLRASQALSGEIRTETLLAVVMRTVLEHAGATRGVLAVFAGTELRVEAVAAVVSGVIEVSVERASLGASFVPESLVHYVARTHESVIIGDARDQREFSDDVYLASGLLRSALCLPLSNGNKLLGVLYLENHLTPHAFTPARGAALSMLAAQAAISLENSHLYAERDAAEGRLRLIIDTIPTLVWCARVDGEIEFFNRQWLDYTGFTAVAALEGGWHQSLHPVDAPAMREWWKTTLESDRAGEIEARLRRADGSHRWFLFRVEPLRSEQGQVVQWYGTNTDIEARKRAELELDSKLRYVTMLSQISAGFSSGLEREIQAALGQIGEFFAFDAVTIYWLAEGRQTATAIHTWAPSAEDTPPVVAVIKAFGGTATRLYNGGEVRIGTLRELPEPERSRLQERNVGAVAALPLIVSGVTVASMNFTCRRERAWPDEEWSRIRIVGEIFASTFGRYHALRELERSEAALQTARANLAHATRVATLGELAATIAHEINQPLAAIVSDAAAALNWLSASTIDAPNVRESLGAILRQGDRAGQVLTRIRSMIRRSDAENVRCDMRLLIEGVLPLVRVQLERQHVELTTSLPATSAFALVDAIELQQVVLNLVLNAADATRDAGRADRRVSVSCAAHDGDSGPMIVVAVEDNGTGVGDDAARLFEAFYTTKSSGLGMGLPISRSIIERHAGRLWVESNDGGGATFRFSLPGVS